MKIGIAQINPVVGDFKGNARRILGAYRACIDAGAELVVTPELSLVGYPAGDLVLKKRFVDQCAQALDYLADETGEVGLLVGHIDVNFYEESQRPGKSYYNSASLLHEGEVKGTVHKTLLPSYDVYDEHSYFEPSASCEPIVYKGVNLGVTIGEDIWCDEIIQRPIHDRNPVEELKAGGADVIINMTATSFQVGKPQFKANLLEVYACGVGLPLVYCNCVGGNDQFVFDGHSLVLDKNGNSIADLPGFQQCIKVCDFFSEAEHAPVIRGKSIEHMLDALVLGVKDYAKKLGYERVCVGISGGIDSAVTAALASFALGPQNVIGVTMPSANSSEEGIADAIKVAKSLGILCHTADISSTYDAALQTLSPLFGDLEKDVTEENIQARLRGMFLMALSNKHDYLVLGAGNKSDYFIGNYTTNGDVSVGLSVLADVPKKLVYKLAEWINDESEIIPQSIIDKESNDELSLDKPDSLKLPPYNDLDTIIEYYVTYGLSVAEIVEDFGYEENVARWVQRRIDRNSWKREQSAPALRVTSPAFGLGRRIPIVQKFVD